jgi:tripartite-type tricarboxylate transporter receptor subunit TctC
LLAEEIGRPGPTMAIENRPGAGAVIGTEAVSRAPPDGSTLLMLANSFVINPRLRKSSYLIPVAPFLLFLCAVGLGQRIAQL